MEKLEIIFIFELSNRLFEVLLLYFSLETEAIKVSLLNQFYGVSFS